MRMPTSTDVVELVVDGDKVRLYCLICGQVIGEDVSYLNEALMVWERHQDEKRPKEKAAVAALDGDKVCLREVEVTTATVASPAPWFFRPPEPHVLCLQPLPCNNPHHKPERGSA